MYAEYKRDMSHNYLILHGENPVDTSSYQVRMLTGNVVFRDWMEISCFIMILLQDSHWLHSMNRRNFRFLISDLSLAEL